MCILSMYIHLCYMKSTGVKKVIYLFVSLWLYWNKVCIFIINLGVTDNNDSLFLFWWLCFENGLYVAVHFFLQLNFISLWFGYGNQMYNEFKTKEE